MGRTSRLVRRCLSSVHSRVADGPLHGSMGRCAIAQVGGGIGPGDRVATSKQGKTSASAVENASGEGGRAHACEGDGISAKVNGLPVPLASRGALRRGK